MSILHCSRSHMLMFRIAIKKLFEWLYSRVLAWTPGTSSLGWRWPWSSLYLIIFCCIIHYIGSYILRDEGRTESVSLSSWTPVVSVKIIFFLFEGMEGEPSPPLTASFWRQLKSTLVRNLIRKKRNKRHTLRVSNVVFMPCFCEDLCWGSMKFWCGCGSIPLTNGSGSVRFWLRSVLCICIGFLMRVQIQHLWSMRRFWWPKFYIYSRTELLLPEGRLNYRRSLQISKENIYHFTKHEIS